MSTHSSVLAWRIPGTEEPGGLPSRVAQSQTWLKRLSSSSSSRSYVILGGSLHFSGCCLVTKSCPALCDPMAVARQPPLSMGFPRQEYWSGYSYQLQGSSWRQDQTHFSCTARQILYHWVTWEALTSWYTSAKSFQERQNGSQDPS